MTWSDTSQTYNLTLDDCYELTWGRWTLDEAIDGQQIRNVVLGTCVSLSGGELVLTNCADAIWWSKDGVYVAGKLPIFQRLHIV